MKRRNIMLVALCLLAAPSAAPAQDWAQAKRVEVDLANFKYTPNRIVLRHGQPYVLHFVNQAHGGHNFVARTFFESAHVERADGSKVAAGEVDLDGGESLDVRLVAPASAGIFPVRCSHFMHEAFGMKGQIEVQ